MEGTLQYSKAVEAAAKKVTPRVLDDVIVQVEFSTKKGIFEDYIQAEYSALVYYEQQHGRGDLPDWLTEDVFSKYCASALVSRIMWVNDKPRDVIFRPEEDVLVPSLLDNILKNIGKVSDPKLGITLMPTLAEDMKWSASEGNNSAETDVLDRETIFRVSSFLKKTAGYIGGLGYLKDKSGTWDFMTMQCLETSVYNFTPDSHPAYSLLAAVVAPAWLKSAVDWSPRVRYGNLTFYKTLLTDLTSV